MSLQCRLTISLVGTSLILMSVAFLLLYRSVHADVVGQFDR